MNDETLICAHCGYDLGEHAVVGCYCPVKPKPFGTQMEWRGTKFSRGYIAELTRLRTALAAAEAKARPNPDSLRFDEWGVAWLHAQLSEMVRVAKSARRSNPTQGHHCPLRAAIDSICDREPPLLEHIRECSKYFHTAQLREIDRLTSALAAATEARRVAEDLLASYIAAVDAYYRDPGNDDTGDKCVNLVLIDEKARWAVLESRAAIDAARDTKNGKKTAMKSSDLTPAMLRRMHAPVTLRQPNMPIPAPSSLASVPLPTLPQPDRPPKKRSAGLAKPRGRRKMNKVEAAYALILEAEKRKGEWLRYDWEGMTLRWPDGMTYTPDFCALAPENDQEPASAVVVWLIETKGPWIEEDAKVKYRAARAYWPQFHFLMMQQDKNGQWTQIL